MAGINPSGRSPDDAWKAIEEAEQRARDLGVQPSQESVQHYSDEEAAEMMEGFQQQLKDLGYRRDTFER